MRVLMIAPTPFFAHRGTHIRIFEEARALEQRGHEVTIVTYHNGDDIGDYVETSIDVRRIRRWLFWYKKMEAGADWQKIILNLFLIRKALYMAFVLKPHVVHGHLHEGVLIGRLLQCVFFWRRVPLVADFHGSLVGEMRSHGYLKVRPLKTIFSFLERWINGLGNVAIASSAENLPAIRDARRDHRAYHVYDGVDIAAYDRLGRDKNTLREKYGVPTNAFVVIYTGALIANKGVDAILGAAEILKDDPITFVIGGFPDMWVRKYIGENSLEKSVKVISPLNYFMLPEVNGLADIAVDPKSDEGNTRQASGKILQYMATGVPIICADRPTNRKYLDDAGVYINSVDAKTIAQTIKDLYNKEDVRSRKGEHARKRAKVFHWKKVGEKLEGVYQSVIRTKVI